jgi:polysaccharide deacetylase family protein (PEP-CTERM system associated)
MPGPLIVTVDVEDWYMSPEAIGWRAWERYADRLAVGLERLLELLARHQATATFFWLGQLAQGHPGLVRKCCEDGHEIALHGWDHRPVWMLGHEGFRVALTATRQHLQNLTGQAVDGYRAPEYSLRRGCGWMWQALTECGVTYDSSLNPVSTYLYGDRDNQPFPHRLTCATGAGIVEWPVSTVRLLGRRWPAACGAFLRILPGCWLRTAARRWEQETAAAAVHGDAARLVVNVHPWELDPWQPELALPWKQRWIHRVGLGSTQAKLDWLLGASDTQTMGRAVAGLGNAH